jgi:hypothetical protein
MKQVQQGTPCDFSPFCHNLLHALELPHDGEFCFTQHSRQHQHLASGPLANCRLDGTQIARRDFLVLPDPFGAKGTQVRGNRVNPTLFRSWVKSLPIREARTAIATSQIYPRDGSWLLMGFTYKSGNRIYH